MTAPFLQSMKILLGYRVFIHIGVHSRRKKHCSLSSQQGGSQHIICHATGTFGNNISCCRSHQHHISQLSQGNMLHIILLYFLPHGGYNRITADFPHSSFCNKILGTLGENHMNISPLLPQTANQIHTFVGGNTASYTQNNIFIF